MLEFNLGPADQGMDWLQFIAAIVGAIAWPIAAVTIAWMFKRQISALLDKVRKLSWGDGSIDLDEKLTEVEAVAFDGPPTEPEDPKRSAIPTAARQPEGATITSHPTLFWKSGAGKSWSGELNRRLDLFAPDQVDEDWRSVEVELRRVPNSFGKPWPEGLSAATMIEILAAEGKLDARLYAMLMDLASIHRASTMGGVSVSEAWRFQTLAHQVITALKKIQDQHRPPDLF